MKRFKVRAPDCFATWFAGKQDSASYLHGTLARQLSTDYHQAQVRNTTKDNDHHLEGAHEGIHEDVESVPGDRDPFRLQTVNKIGRKQNKQHPEDIDTLVGTYQLARKSGSA
jgi:hypothetical protein